MKGSLALVSKPTSIIISIIITIDAVAYRTLNKGKGKVFRDACRHCRPSVSRMLLSSKHCLLRMNSSGSISNCDKELLLLQQSQSLLINSLAA